MRDRGDSQSLVEMACSVGQWQAAVYEAIIRGNSEPLRPLIESSTDIVSPIGETPLMWAAMFYNQKEPHRLEKLLAFIINQHPEPRRLVEAKRYDGSTVEDIIRHKNGANAFPMGLAAILAIAKKNQKIRMNAERNDYVRGPNGLAAAIGGRRKLDRRTRQRRR